MKIIILLLMLTMTGYASAQTDEPEEITTDGMIETIGRDEIESEDKEDLKLDNNISDFKIPLIEFDEKNVKSDSKATTTNKAQKSDVSNTVPRIVIAEKPVSLSQLQKNDKLVVTKSGTVFMYRLVGQEITQYRLLKSPNLKSRGVTSKGGDSFYVINPGLLIRDSREDKTDVAEEKSDNQDEGISGQEAEERRAIEKEYNRGKHIDKSLRLKNLHVNDEVYIIGQIQLVIRKQKSTGSTKKYWLIEKLNLESSSVEKDGNNKYKIIRLVTPES